MINLLLICAQAIEALQMLEQNKAEYTEFNVPWPQKDISPMSSPWDRIEPNGKWNQTRLYRHYVESVRLKLV